MQGSFLILTFLSLAIVGVLYLQRSKPPMSAKIQAKEIGIETQQMQDLQKETRKKLMEIQKKEMRRVQETLEGNGN